MTKYIYIYDKGCDNGECRENTCVCKQGYLLDKTGKFCVPVCDPPCGKGKCTEPNTCSCSSGYELTATGACVPTCSKGCEYGECIAPEKCDCRPGYIFKNSLCSPVCERYSKPDLKADFFVLFF